MKYIILFSFLMVNLAMANSQGVKVENKEDKSKYSNYLSVYIKDLKCEGYDFDPEKVVTIDLTGLKFDKLPSGIDFTDPWVANKIKNLDNAYEINGGYVELDNGKKYWINNRMGNCPGIILKGKDSYKQLPDGCRFVIGDQCIEPPSANCKKLSKDGINCWDKDIKQDNKLFQWEATNKGWERMTSYREYWEDDLE